MVAAEQHFYTAFGEEFELIAGSKTIRHGYNALGQRTSSQWSGAYSQLETRTYNGVGLVETVAVDGFAKTMLYDVWHGTPSFESFMVEGQGWKTQFHHSDVAKNYDLFTDAEGGQHEWVVDENNRVREIRYAGQAVCGVFYTPGGLVDRTELRDASGTVIARTTHSYDGLGRKIRQETVQAATGQVVAEFEWGYDSLDLVTLIRANHLGVRADLVYNERRELVREQWSENGGGQSAPPYANITGDPQGVRPESNPSNEAQGRLRQLLPVGGVLKVYEFDPAGNRTFTEINGVRTTYTHNSASQLVDEVTPGAPAVHHEYDEWGNEIARTASGGATETYGYNYLNLLSTYISAPGADPWQYAFWPTGERYSKSHANNPSDAELYVPRFGDVATEYADPSTLKNAYVQGTGIDQKCTRIGASGERRHYLGDSVGTVNVTLSDTAASVETSLKDVWGNQLSGGTASERYGFAQREHDRESGLVHMRARMYDPKLGRFTQGDPIIGNRPTEHYAYGGNNPVSKTDPLGLQEMTAEELEAMRIIIPKAAAIAKETVKGAFVEGNNPYYKTAKAYKDFATTPGARTKEVIRDAFVEGNNPYRQSFVAEQQRLVDVVDISMDAGDSAKLATVKMLGVAASDLTGGTKVAEGLMEKDSNTRYLLANSVPRHLQPEESLERITTGGLQVLSNAAIGAQGLNNFRFWLRTSNKLSLGPGAAAIDDPAFNSGQIIYRGGDPSPSNLKVRPGEEGLSFRTSLSNPVPPPPAGPVLRPGKPYFGVDTSKLPPGSVILDDVPPGHATVRNATVDDLKRAVVERGKFPQ